MEYAIFESFCCAFEVDLDQELQGVDERFKVVNIQFHQPGDGVEEML